MTFTSTVTVQFGPIAGNYENVSDRVQGAQITTRVRTGDFGNNRATLTLRNDDGELTPGAGGTWSSIDWFAQGLFISGNTGSFTYDLFHGVITRFSLQDDGVNSTVVLEADDGFSVGGAATTSITAVTTGEVQGTLTEMIDRVYNGYASAPLIISGVTMPLLNGTSADVEVTTVGLTTATIGFSQFSTTAAARDFVRRSLMPSAPNVAWPTVISVSGSLRRYKAYACQIYPVRTTTGPSFAENATGDELPFRELQRGFATDDLLNNAVVTTLNDSPGQVVRSATRSNASSAAKYGARSIQATSIVPGISDTGPLKTTTIAERWANVYSSSEFSVRQFVVTEAMVRRVTSPVNAQLRWAELLDIETGPLTVSTIEFTPAGSSTTVTETFVIMSRTIQIVPGDIRLTVECLPIDQTGAFVLGSSTLGVLDTNRLG